MFRGIGGEFKRPGFYLLLGVFALCTIPPIVWNAQHAWITLDHLRARGGLDKPFRIPSDRAPRIFWRNIFWPSRRFCFWPWSGRSWPPWPRVQTQFKSLYLFWFGLPVFALYFLLSFNDPAAPNWDCLAFISLAPLAMTYWNERMQTNRHSKNAAIVGIFLGLLMSMLALNTDILRSANFHFPRARSEQPAAWLELGDQCAGKLRTDLETKNGQPLFLIADERDRAAEIAFYLRDKRTEGPGTSAGLYY